MRYLVFGASQREKSYNVALAKLAAGVLQQARMKVDVLDYAAICPPTYDDKKYKESELPKPVQLFLEHLRKADAVIIAAPEYNWSYPGSLKTLIDWLSLVRPYPFNGKPVLLLSASTSRRGGFSGLSQLKLPLAALGAHVYPQFFTLAQAADAMSKSGELRDRDLRSELESLLFGFMEMTDAFCARRSGT
jgi:chromate reductase, NAD(P)H dehydrogenase (quinone)